jgi:hypothetical protein
MDPDPAAGPSFMAQTLTASRHYVRGAAIATALEQRKIPFRERVAAGETLSDIALEASGVTESEASDISEIVARHDSDGAARAAAESDVSRMVKEVEAAEAELAAASGRTMVVEVGSAISQIRNEFSSGAPSYRDAECSTIRRAGTSVSFGDFQLPRPFELRMGPPDSTALLGGETEEGGETEAAPAPAMLEQLTADGTWTYQFTSKSDGEIIADGEASSLTPADLAFDTLAMDLPDLHVDSELPGTLKADNERMHLTILGDVEMYAVAASRGSVKVPCALSLPRR